MTYTTWQMGADQTVELTEQITKLVLYSLAALFAFMFALRRKTRCPKRSDTSPDAPMTNFSDAIPPQCDFEAVAYEIREMLKMAQDEAKAQGQEAHFQHDFLSALVPFLETPSRETAIPLVQCFPELRKYFEAYGPNGDFTAYKRILGDLAKHSDS